MELTDIHNRRANIELVSKRAKEHGYPLLVWPEDKELLRLDDLPTTDDPNKPTDWLEVSYTRYSICRTDQQLREFIREGFAYVQGVTPRHDKAPRRVDEYKVVTR